MQPLEQLPHLIVEEPKRSKAAVISIVIISLVLLSLPVGLFLVGNPQQYFSQASVDEAGDPKLSLEIKSPGQSLNAGDESFVDIWVRSDLEQVNLVEASIGFDPGLINVTGVELSDGGTQSFAREWLSRGFSNEKGEVVLIGGNPAPGITTKPSDKPLFFARISFKALSEGNAKFSFNNAALYKNSDNSNALKTKQDLTVNISPGGVSGQIQPNIGSQSAVPDEITITSPKTGEVFYYFRPFDINWTGNFQTVQVIRLLINGERYADLVQNIENSGKFTWTPSATVPAPYITKVSTFQVEIEGRTDEGKIIISSGGGEFGLISDAGGKLVSGASGEIKLSVDADVADGSRILTRFGVNLEKPDELDLNGDLVLNGLDLALLRKGLAVKDLVL